MILGRVHYLAAFALVTVGLFIVIDDENLLKKVLGLNVFQTGVLLFLVAAGYRTGGGPPVGDETAVNPVPQVLVLTAIVVGMSVTAVALALIVRLYREYGTLSEAAIREAASDE